MKLTHLEELESEAIYIIRETASQFEKPALLFSGGKDSITLAHLIKKAFYPAKIPFPLVHIDTGHNFQETIEFRDKYINSNDFNLIVGSVEEAIKGNEITEEKGQNASRNSLQTHVLLKTITDNNFDACLGGARRDEEKSRAKERFFSHRDEFGQWNPKNQRPELWNIFNGRKNPEEHFRIFPISNWTELDVWNYIKQENIKLPSLYFAHTRKCFERNGQLLADTGVIKLTGSETSATENVRFRTIGDITCTGAFRSDASTLDDIIQEVSTLRESERGGRQDDQRSETSMEDRKKLGYF